MRKNDNRVKQLETALRSRATRQPQILTIASEGWAYRLVDIYRLTDCPYEGRNKEYLGGVSLAELARRAGVEPYGKLTGDEMTDEDYREILLEEEECEAKGWVCAPVGDFSFFAWFAWIDGKFTRVAELRCLEGLTPEQNAELERRERSRH
ncbi:hypothetical protein EST62_00515 [Chlorobaculum sp. 24CR]|uniref:hypothetical protein n=1 Tax=Chlorobaculum sp. 24CR TaxID=2508878 RepID=UPI00100A70E8|nr:hypothetical protein [Chlorobaculum sp. 24CR]RXK89059.1 hypothetical protein EST62_00515 [Chlorobaculum sp. 24CR]